MSDDTDDWTEIEPANKPSQLLPDVSIRLGFRGNPITRHSGRATASITFRRDAAEWIKDHGPRFRVQIGGEACNRLRIISDAAGGRFESHDLKGVQRLTIGHINLWPNEQRGVTEATIVEFQPGAMVLTLPQDFARPQAKPTPKPAEAPPAPVATAQPFPVTTRAEGLAIAEKSAAGRARIIDRRPTGVVDLGEPPPGRSALDQRRGK